MKEFGKNIALFVPFAGVLYLLFLIFSVEVLPEKYVPNVSYKVGYAGHSLSRFQEASQTEKIDILFVGSSHTYRGFDPRLFSEYKTFNLGSSSQTPIQTEMLLKRYVEKLKPRVIVYEVYPLTFTLDGIESACDLIANDNNDRYSLSMVLKTNKVKVYNTLIYGFYNDLIGRNEGVKEAVYKYGDHYVRGGYVERDLSYYSVKSKKVNKKYNFLASQLDAFESTLNYLKLKNIEVILVQTPIPKSEFKSYTNNSEFDHRMKARGLPYYNFNDLMEFNDSLHFYDHSHMNQNGVILFNQKLQELIDFKEVLKQ